MWHAGTRFLISITITVLLIRAVKAVRYSITKLVRVQTARAVFTRLLSFGTNQSCKQTNSTTISLHATKYYYGRVIHEIINFAFFLSSF